MVYSKGRILLQSAEERGTKKNNSTPIPSSPSQSLWSISQAGKGAGEAKGAAGGTATAAPGPVEGVRTKRQRGESLRNKRQTVLVLCCLKLGGARGQAERGELVFLQVPGFKKLQALLHSQAFLQTLGETKDRASDTGGRWWWALAHGEGAMLRERSRGQRENGLLGGEVSGTC